LLPERGTRTKNGRIQDFMPKNENRCWPGYEPVKGKPANSQGSCRPKAETKLTPSEKEFRQKREQQLAEWQEQHAGSPPKAAQHLRAPKKNATKTSGGKPKSKAA